MTSAAHGNNEVQQTREEQNDSKIVGDYSGRCSPLLGELLCTDAAQYRPAKVLFFSPFRPSLALSFASLPPHLPPSPVNPLPPLLASAALPLFLRLCVHCTSGNV